MKMNLSNEKIVADAEALGLISQKQLPVKVSYAISKNIAKIELELKVYNDERQKLVEKYSIKDNDGKTLVEDGKVTIQPEYVDNWNTDTKSLMSIENEFDIHLIKLDDLLCSNCAFSPFELMQIDYMIEKKL